MMVYVGNTTFNDELSVETAISVHTSQGTYASGDREDYLCRSGTRERYGIITCGEHITRRPGMPFKEYHELSSANSNKNNETSLALYSEYITYALDAKSVPTMQERARVLPKCFSTTSKAEAFYVQDLLMLFSQNVYLSKPMIDLAKSESVYNFYLVHPTIGAVVAALQSQSTVFVPGEEPLRSMSAVLKKSNEAFNEREAYKSDGVIRAELTDDQDGDEDDHDYEAEVLLLEISNAFGVAKKVKKADLITIRRHLGYCLW
ncbi:hypothetical protein BJV82DRAFT_623930 [Fennellomyces sp. T-0311]|nr:hypothetical protein BJV82DRAFT_623930 [Fennellomyces sp. T-0311]